MWCRSPGSDGPSAAGRGQSATVYHRNKLGGRRTMPLSALDEKWGSLITMVNGGAW